jgi:hypothetical protein
METSPPKKGLSLVPFVVQITRGLLRDQRARRRIMGVSLLISLVMVVAGLTVLRSWLNPHEHPWRFMCFWLVCAWETVLMLLLALLDILLIRAQGRAERRFLHEHFSAEQNSEPSGRANQNNS